MGHFALTSLGVGMGCAKLRKVELETEAELRALFRELLRNLGKEMKWFCCFGFLQGFVFICSAESVEGVL